MAPICFIVNTLEGNRKGGFFPGNSTKLAPSMQIGGYKRGKIKFNPAWFLNIISSYFRNRILALSDRIGGISKLCVIITDQQSSTYRPLCLGKEKTQY